MVTITTNTLRRTIFKTVYDILNTSVDLNTTTVVSWFTIPDDLTKVSFPIISVTRPSKESEEITNIKEVNNYQQINIVIDVFTKSNDSCQRYADLIDKVINDNKSVIREAGLKHIILEDAPPNEPLPINSKNHIHSHTLILVGDRYK